MYEVQEFIGFDIDNIDIFNPDNLDMILHRILQKLPENPDHKIETVNFYQSLLISEIGEKNIQVMKISYIFSFLINYIYNHYY